MKRELCAAALLLMLLAGAALNVHAADCVTDTVERSLRRTELAAQRGDFEAARTALENGREVWSGYRTYIHIFFRHPDVDAIHDAFFELEQLLRQEDEAWPAALSLLRYHLESIDYMEHVSLGTVF